MYRLTHSFPFLVNRVGVRMGELASRRLAVDGLTLSMYRVMAALWERPDQNLGELAQSTSVELTSLSRLLGVMVTKKLVVRRRPEGNSRTVSIKLTRHGRLLTEELIKFGVQHEKIALRGLDPDTVVRLKQDLEQVYANLTLLEPEMPDSFGAKQTKDRVGSGEDASND